MGLPSQIMEKKSVLYQNYDDIRTNDGMGMFLHKVHNIKTKSGSSSKNFAAEVQN